MTSRSDARPGCWIAAHVRDAGPCDGALIKAHLIPRQVIERELGMRTGRLSRARYDALVRSVVWDPRVWVPVCGGPMGLSGHHGKLDGKQLVVPRAVLPPELEEYAREHGLEWRLDHDYGEVV